MPKCLFMSFYSPFYFLITLATLMDPNKYEHHYKCSFFIWIYWRGEATYFFYFFTLPCHNSQSYWLLLGGPTNNPFLFSSLF
ncbi:hypothetical protein BCR41DRAFT_358046 [Lobosporangium transversale]|uniref:Uncharacterized protein n=1 Tax=Lobosporangium transversale TaxID=64571 RepID=A0A1Y2GG65_9FUNG|nr:hypothetical protein BCR41DRAFT_358046 [Lobosporangium transversale]ORZ09987.1 hypothetical protein BCR41DRAFT_358046 [Lobosporangium transversale]|eukprot:XP_021879077.1 hypothetical protein BCR41DRAFT_358046 [Lobosporangium transversale]